MTSRLVRVVVQHTPALFSILGLQLPAKCPPTMTQQDQTFFKSRETPRWVLYKPALLGGGSGGRGTFHSENS